MLVAIAHAKYQLQTPLTGYVTDHYQNEDTHATCISIFFLDRQL